MQIIRAARKEAASIIWSVHPKINKLLYLHNQLGNKRKKKTMCKLEAYIIETLDHSKSSRLDFFTTISNFLQTLQRSKSLSPVTLSFASHTLPKTVHARMPDAVKHHLAWPCTIKPLMKAPKYLHEIFRASYVMQTCWCKLITIYQSSLRIFFSTILVHVFSPRMLWMLIKIIINRRSSALRILLQGRKPWVKSYRQCIK